VAELSAPLAVVELPGGSSIVIEAVDPTTGAAVSGVKVSGQAVTAVDLSDQDQNQAIIDPAPASGAYLYGEDT